MTKTGTAFVLVGGKGTRLRSAVSDRPKPMAEVAGRPFLEHLLDYWISQGLERFVFCVGYMSDSISTHFGDSYRGKAIEYSADEGEPGTGGALSNALSKYPQSGNFLVLNGDTFFPVPLQALERSIEEDSADWVMGLFLSSNADRYSPVFTDESNRVLRIGGYSRESGASSTGEFLVNGGVHLSRGSVFEGSLSSLQLPFSTEKALSCMISDDHIRMIGVPFGEIFLDIGTPDDLIRAQTIPDFLP